MFGTRNYSIVVEADIKSLMLNFFHVVIHIYHPHSDEYGKLMFSNLSVRPQGGGTSVLSLVLPGRYLRTRVPHSQDL